MGSRAEGGPPAVFDWFFEAACPASLQEDPPILRQFPPDFRDQEAMQMVPKFCFPFDVEREPPSPAVQHFTFALTDLAGNRRFGFCRLRAGAQSCLCILSHLPWFEVFYKLLNTVGDLLAQDQVSEAEELLLNLLQQPPPGPQVSRGPELGGGVTISGVHGILPPAPGNSRLLSCFVAPDSGSLPSIPENRNLTELVVAVTDENIVGLFAALLAERRVLLTASKLSTLTSCVHASCALLYPMRWEHVLIPTLPPHLLDYCCAPMPYLIGVHASLAERVRDKALEDVVVLNIDSNTLETPFEDVQTLPPDVVSLLRLRLRKVALSPGEGVSRLFLKAQALLFGGYRDALVCSPGQPVTFSEEAFLAQKPGAPLQAFHQRAVHLQLFKQFIEARLEKLNSGEGFSDTFEQEISCCRDSSGEPPAGSRVLPLPSPSQCLPWMIPALLTPGTLRSYQLWADHLKKGGGALLHSVKAKTQPAVRIMYRSAKSGLKGMQSLLLYKDGDSGLHRGGSLRTASLTSRSDRLQQRLPITQHFGQPDLPGRTRWQPDEEKLPEPQPLSLPADLPSFPNTPSLEITCSSKNPNSQLLSGSSQEIISPSQLSTASTDTSSPGDPESSPLTEPSTLRLSPLPKATEHPAAWEIPCTRLSEAHTQPSPPESPPLLAPVEPNFDTVRTPQSPESSPDPSFPKNPRTQPPKVLLEHAHSRCPEEPGTPNTLTSPTSDWQEPQARKRPRVADLKKCFEG
uniref:DENN domain-containing protein 1C isoform X3 n=1 Tax=Ictidomys tridecemlineatus TaxID=43179 RepID=UPI001A9EC039|nr:DENN domain-containing protein 1C isoform X3 [Ictidomys tridecemlineatus]